MKLIIFAALFALVAARPDTPYGDSSASSEEVTVERDDRVAPSAAGEYSLDLELSDGTKITESGYGSGPDGAVETQGSVQYISPEGEAFSLTYVADAAGGYQPESDALPVAPAFPHPIPQFVLDQIAFAASQDSSEEEESSAYA